MSEREGREKEKEKNYIIYKNKENSFQTFYYPSPWVLRALLLLAAGISNKGLARSSFPSPRKFIFFQPPFFTIKNLEKKNR